VRSRLSSSTTVAAPAADAPETPGCQVGSDQAEGLKLIVASILRAELLK
jgi:hypothetical protein